jgi:hypothetical protein
LRTAISYQPSATAIYANPKLQLYRIVKGRQKREGLQRHGFLNTPFS